MVIKHIDHHCPLRSKTNCRTQIEYNCKDERYNYCAAHQFLCIGCGVPRLHNQICSKCLKSQERLAAELKEAAAKAEKTAAELSKRNIAKHGHDPNCQKSVKEYRNSFKDPKKQKYKNVDRDHCGGCTKEAGIQKVTHSQKNEEATRGGNKAHKKGKNAQKKKGRHAKK